MKLRDRVARAMPSYRVKSRLCTDRFHSPETDELSDDLHAAMYATEPKSVGDGWTIQGFQCPTCGLATLREVPRWQEPWVMLKLWIKDKRCERAGHPIPDGYISCRCLERIEPR
jgi:hypothetical protein